MRRLLDLLRRNQGDRELENELAFHRDMLIEEKLRQGLLPEEARDAAIRELGPVTQIRETHRDLRGLPLLESLIADLRHGARLARQNLLFSATVIATLALGIGATTAVFTVANAILLSPVPVPHPERAVVLQSSNPKEGTRFTVAEGVFHDWRERSTSFELMAGVWPASQILTGNGQPHIIDTVCASPEFFAFTGTKPVIGRLFDKFDDVALLDEAYWRRNHNARTDILGETIILDDRPHTIIGVVPTITGPIHRTSIYVPLKARPEARSGGSTVVLARLRPGKTLQAAQSELDAIHETIRREHIEDAGFTAAVTPLHDWIVEEARPALLALTGAVAVLLLICCLNIANLLLARATARHREFAIRASLGGGPTRLARQILAENSLYALTGGICGYALAHVLMRAIPHIKGVYIPRAGELHADARMLVITIVVTFLATALFSLVPARHGAREDLRHLLTTSTRATAGRDAFQLRSGLVVFQLALSLVLLSGAGLLLNSFVRLLTVDVGFTRPNLIAVNIRFPWKQYKPEDYGPFHQRLREELRTLPGVLQVSSTDHLPLQAVHFPYYTTYAGRQLEIEGRHVGVDYFKVLGIPILAGREFTHNDDNRSPVPIVVSQGTAHRLFGDERAIGKRITVRHCKNRPVLEVVGVAANTRQLGLKEQPGPQMYIPVEYGYPQHAILEVDPRAGTLHAAIRDIVFRLDPSVPTPTIEPINALFEREYAKPRFYLLLLGSFSLLGLILAAVGIYGVIAYGISRRTHEIGVRMAVGASSTDILQLIFNGALKLIASGAILGVFGASTATKLLDTLLYSIKPNDAPTLLAAIAVLALTATAATYIAARKAAALEPTIALRHE